MIAPKDKQISGGIKKKHFLCTSLLELVDATVGLKGN